MINMNTFKLKSFFIKMIGSRRKENVVSVPRDKCIKTPQEKGRSVGRGVRSRSCPLTLLGMIITTPVHVCVSLLFYQRTYKRTLPSQQRHEASRSGVIFPTWWLLFIFSGGGGGQWLNVWTLEPGMCFWIWVPAFINSDLGHMIV